MSKEPSEFLDWLRQLSKHNINYFLEGGQAVNLWAYRFASVAPRLASYLPFTSKDCDIWIDENGVKRIGGILNGYLKKDPNHLMVNWVFSPPTTTSSSLIYCKTFSD